MTAVIHPAEIFDMVQYLFDTTGFNDHQLHGVIHFGGKADACLMEKAFGLLLEAVPAFTRVYIDAGGRSYWDDGGADGAPGLFSVTGSAEEFEAFIVSKTDAARGPQIKGCLYQGERDALSVVANHMVTDGAGFKECLYLLAQIYSGLATDPSYRPDIIVDGDRSFDKILSGNRLRDRLSSLLRRGGDNNDPGAFTFPLPGGETEPFILTHALTTETYRGIVVCGKEHGATVNDVLLAAYFRALSAMLGLGGKPLSLPLMIDMRRHLEDKSFHAPANLASDEILTVAVAPGEDFYTTLRHISGIMKARKGDLFGLNSFIKLWVLFRLSGRGLAYRLLEKGLRNPNICITNIGVIDDSRLIFQGVGIDNAVVTGSIKYRPHFQMSVTSYRDKMTLAVNLYGSGRDRVKIGEFFDQMDRELEAVTG